jgi:2'-5' RNA ligase
MNGYYFLGIPLPKGLQESVEDFRSKFPRLGNLKTKPHITLTAPLKLTSDRDLPLVEIEKVFKEHAPLNIHYGPVANFGNRILYLAVISNDLIQLQLRLAELWSLKENRPYHPHITILNNRTRDGDVSIAALKQIAIENFQNGEFVGKSLNLYHRSEGESFRVLKSFASIESF